jgi:iron complex outermembrane recepter protein
MKTHPAGRAAITGNQPRRLAVEAADQPAPSWGKPMQIRRTVTEVAAAGLLLAGSPIHAETATPTDGLEEIVVTAAKREEKLHDVAMSITALSGEDLARRMELGYTDFAAQVPGLAIESLDPGRNRVILRGENVGGIGATIATTVDDIPFFMSGSQSNGVFFSANVDTYDLQRVEVLRGPQGTLYGASSEGGLIKYVTNAPNLNAYEGAVSVGGETIDGGQSGGFAKGLVNIPFWDNRAALRVSAVEEEIPGWIDNSETGQHDVNHGEKYSLRASLLLEPTSDLKIRVTAFNQALDVRGDDNVQVVGAALTPATPPANQFAPVNGFNNPTAGPHVIDDNLSYYALNVQYDFKVATLMSATSFGDIRKQYSSDSTNVNVAPGVTLADALAGVYGEPVAVFGDQLETLHKLNQELRLTSDPGSTVFGNPFDWLAGGFFTRETTGFNQAYDARSAADPATILAPAAGADILPAQYKESAFFADFTYHFSKAFDLELGGRNTKTQQQSQSTVFCCVLIGPTTTFPTTYVSETDRTWSVAPRWHITDDLLAYVRVATGFSPGGPNQPSPLLLNPPSYRSDSTRNYEVGLRADLFDKRFTVDMDIFDIRWKDVQIVDLVQTASGPVGLNGNSGSAESRGVEWNLLWRPVQGLSLGLLGAYTDAKLTSDAATLGGMNGDALPYVPEVSSTFNADYTWHAFGNYAGFVGSSWTYTGTRYTDFSSSVSTVESHVKLPVYNTLQVQAGLDNGHYNIELFGNNLTNARGITEYANSGGQNQTGLAAFIQPRTIGIELGVKF